METQGAPRGGSAAMAALADCPGPPPGAAGAPATHAGVWEWDDNERGIVLTSQDPAPREASRAASRLAVARAARGGAGCLLSSLDVTFQDVVSTLDQIRFRRLWRRRTLPGHPDVVTLQDIKDVVLFQVQQRLPADFLRLFHTAAVDRFLHTLILYCFHFTQTCEWVSFKYPASGRQILEAGLRPRQRRLQRCLAALRVLLARDYHALLLGDAAPAFHHMSGGTQSWSQRDARLWELLLRVSARVASVALQRRHVSRIDAEVGRLFRSEAFSMAGRRRRRQQAADALDADEGRPASPHARRARELRDEILYGAAADKSRRLFTRSPATLELVGRPGLEPHWTLLALGRMPLPSLSESLRRVEAAYSLGEEGLPAGENRPFIGILGMPRNSLDVMLNVKDKQRRHELLLSGSSVQQCSSLFPTEEDNQAAEPGRPESLDAFPSRGIEKDYSTRTAEIPSTARRH